MKTLVLAGMMACIYSCNSRTDNVLKKDYSKTLGAAPFAGLTDSIGRFPDNADLYLKRAALLSQNNLHELASPDYKKAWEITADDNVALAYVSNLILAGNLPEAIELLNECAAKFPENTEFFRRLGEVYLQQGQPRKALAQYDHIIEKDSSNFEAWFDRGTLLARLKDTNAAIVSLETSFSLLPINYTGIALANLYVTRKDPRALEVCNILLSKDSSGIQTEPLYMKGVYFSEIKDYDNALQQFDECIRRDWKMTDAYIEKGIIMFERKNYPEALKIFSMAATVSNTDADAYYWMGRCFESTGDKEQAVLNYERAFALDQSFSEAREALKRLNS
jgi:tetratricopeptide (TPR) repeat protein